MVVASYVSELGPSAALLLEEYRHLTASLLQNEDRGERRAEWFLIFASAVVALLVAIRPSLRVAVFAVGMVLLLGLITRARIIHRNQTADEYTQKIRGIEQFFIDQDAGLSKYLPYSKRDPQQPRTKKLRSFVTGGALQTVEFANAFAAGVLISMLPGVVTDSEGISIVAVVLGAVAFFAVQFLERMVRAPRVP